MFKALVVDAVFGAGETTATYTTSSVKTNGARDRELHSGDFFNAQGDAGLFALYIPADISASVATVQLYAAPLPGIDSPDWRPVQDTTGDLIAVAVDAETKARAVTVNADLAPHSGLKLVCLDSDGDPVAPGAVTFQLALKG